MWLAWELAKPINVTANGRNIFLRGQEVNTGRSRLEWDPFVGATHYKIWCGLYNDPQYVVATSTVETNYTYQDLKLNTLYRIKVEALNATDQVLSSEIIYTYLTTYKPSSDDYPLPSAGSKIGPIPILGVRPNARYDYSICEDTLEAKNMDSGSTRLRPNESMAAVTDKSEWVEQVEKGIEIWETAVGSHIITATRNKTVTICFHRGDSDSSTPPPSPPLNRVERVTPRDGRLRCRTQKEPPIACALSYSEVLRSGPYPVNKEGNPGAVLLIVDSWNHEDLNKYMVDYIRDPNNPQLCWDPDTGRSFATDPNGNPLLNTPDSVQLFRIAMHEAGHTFGLKDFPVNDPSRTIWDDKTVMNMSHDRLCAPTELDIAAIKALYQSRDSTTAPASGTTTSPTTSATTSTSTTTTMTPTASTTTTTVATTSGNQSVTVWQIETRPTRYDPPSREIEFTFTSGNTFTYSGQTYTISAIKTYNRAPRIQATPDLEDHELPGRTLIRFWPTDTPSRVQTIRLSDGGEMPETHQWDLIWPSRLYPININRNTTWHIDLTIPAGASS